MRAASPRLSLDLGFGLGWAEIRQQQYAGRWKQRDIRVFISVLPDEVGFPCGSSGKKSLCNAGDLSSIPGLRRSPGEVIGYPLQYSWASLVAQLVKICQQYGRPGFNPWVGKIPWRRDRLPTPEFLGFPGGSDGKESTCKAGDAGSIAGLGRSSEEGMEIHSSILVCRIPMDRGAW